MAIKHIFEDDGKGTGYPVSCVEVAENGIPVMSRTQQ